MTKIIILAAGKGSRMNSDLPKALTPIKGRPMIDYLIESVLETGIDSRPTVVVSPENKEVICKSLRGYQLNFAVQSEPLGTGNAVSIAKDFFNNSVKNIIVLYGDHPFISKDSIIRLLENHKSEVSIMTVMLDNFSEWRRNFYHWGRVVRKDNEVEAIVEFKDADDNIREIKEVNPAIFCFDSGWLWNNIDELKNNNNQKEYYLTDLIKIAFEQRVRIGSSLIDSREAIGVNSVEELDVAKSLV